MNNRRLLTVAAVFLVAALSFTLVSAEGPSSDALSDQYPWDEPEEFSLVCDETGTVTGYKGKLPSDLVIPSEIGGVTVVAVGDSVFQYKYGLQTVEFPSTIKEIGDSAFLYCNALKSIVLPPHLERIGEYAFYGCSAAEGSLDLPETLAEMGPAAFKECSSLGSLKLPAGLGSVPESAFADCTGFTGPLTIPEGITAIEGNAFTDCTGFTGRLVIADSVETIGETAFARCNGIQSYQLPAGIEGIPAGMFVGCTGLTGSIVIPDTVTSIGESAFSGCTGLTGTLTIPDAVTEIPDSVFSDCSGLTGPFKFPASLEAIGSFAFQGCDVFGDAIAIPEGVRSIGGSAFSGISAAEASIPASVQELSGAMFSGSTNMTKITVAQGNQYFWSEDGVLFGTMDGKTVLVEYPCAGPAEYVVPADVDLIGTGAFEKSVNLAKVSFADGSAATQILNSAFYDCADLVSVDMCDSIIAINFGAFLNCSGLEHFKFPAKLYKLDDFSFSVEFRVGDLSSFEDMPVYELAGRSFDGSEGVLVSERTPYADPVIHYTDGEGGYYLDGVSGVIPDGVLVVEAEFEGKPIVGILEDALRGSAWLKSVEFRGSNLTQIGDNAFRGCTQLGGKLSIPSSVTTIGSNAFYGCSSISALEFGDVSDLTIGSSAFSECSGIAGVLTFGDGVKKVDGSAFENCTGITGLVIDAPDIEIGYYAFNGCESIVKVEIASKNINEDAFQGLESVKTLVLRETVEQEETNFPVFEGIERLEVYCKYVPGNMFRENTNLREVVFGEGVVSIPEIAFEECTGISGEVVFPSSLEDIGRWAFVSCSSVESFVFPEDSKLVSIDEMAFSGCSKATLSSLPSGLRTIGDYAFNGMATAGSMVLPAALEELGSGAFAGNRIASYSIDGSNASFMTDDMGVLYSKDGKSLILAPLFDGVDFTLGDDVETVCPAAFSQSAVSSFACKEGSALKTIGYNVFISAENLERVVLPAGIDIERMAFYQCGSLKTVVFSGVPGQVDGSAFPGMGFYDGETLLEHSAWVGTFHRDDTSSGKLYSCIEVFFDTDGGSKVAPQYLAEGEKATEPAEAPVREGYEFVGWNLGDAAYDFDAPVDEDTVLVAVWKQLESPSDDNTMLYVGAVIAVVLALVVVFFIMKRKA